MGKINLKSLSLEELQALGGAIGYEIRSKNIEKARKDGRIFRRLKDIPSSPEHAHKFKKTGLIDSEFPGVRGVVPGIRRIRAPSTYACECGERAYSCTNCGYVPGEPIEGKYDNIEALSGSSGLVYHCRECNVELGRKVFAVS